MKIELSIQFFLSSIYFEKAINLENRKCYPTKPFVLVDERGKKANKQKRATKPDIFKQKITNKSKSKNWKTKQNTTSQGVKDFLPNYKKDKTYLIFNFCCVIKL